MGDGKAAVAVQVDVEDGAVELLVLCEVYAVVHPADLADDSAAAALERIANHLGRQEVLLDDQDS